MAVITFNSTGTNSAASSLTMADGANTIGILNQTNARVYLDLETDGDTTLFNLNATFSGGMPFTPRHVFRDNPDPADNPETLRLQLDVGESVVMRVEADTSGTVTCAANAARVGHATGNHNAMRVYWDLVE